MTQMIINHTCLDIKTYEGDDKELQDVTSQKYSSNFDRFVIFEAIKKGNIVLVVNTIKFKN